MTHTPAKKKPERAPRRGGVLVYVVVSVAALIGVCMLAVDWGRVQVAKTEMQRAADAAARAAANEIGAGSGTSAARTAANAYAAFNTVDGSALSLQSGDVVFGKWDPTTATLDTSSSSPDSVRITAVRTQARGNPIPQLIGQILGRPTCDLTVRCLATSTAVPPNGIVGLGSFDAGNNLLIASYNSSTTTSPGGSNYNTNALVGSNGAFTGSGNLYGNARLGPSGTVSGLTISGYQATQTAALNTPASATWSPGSNPGGTSQTWSDGGGSRSLPGGTYWFTSLSVGGTVTFSGPATVYLNGSADVTGTLTAYASLPKNLTIYQIGANTFGNSNGNGASITANIIAPQSDFTEKNNFNFYGQMLFKTITVKNNASFFYDEQFGAWNGGSGYVVTLSQ